MDRIKILFLINTLGGGGAERVLVNLVNNMNYSAFDITVETMFDGGVNVKHLSDNVRYINKKAFCPRGIAQIYRYIPSSLLYKFFIGNEKYDIVVAYMHGAPVKVIEGCMNNDTKKIAWLHTSKPKTSTAFKFWKNEKYAFSAYNGCDAIVGVSDKVADSFQKYTGIKKEKIYTVYNTNDIKDIMIKSNDIIEKFFDNTLKIISVGRLSQEKEYGRLIDIVIRLKNEGFNCSLTIVGSGKLETELKSKILENDAMSFVRLTGFKANPYAYVKNSDLFVCSSHTEGLSTAVTEAVILGVPVVSTDVSGAKEILGASNEYGIITENSEEALYDGLKKMLSDKKLREHYAEKSKERAAFFDTAATVHQAEALFEDVLKGR